MQTKRPSTIQFLPLLVKPTLMSIGICLLWYYVFYRYNISVLEADESAFTDSLIPTLAVFHAIVASVVLSKVWNEYTFVKRCIRKDDVEAFRDCLHERIPRAIHLLLLVWSVLIQAATLVLHWQSPGAGIFANFCIAFTLVLYWEVATNLDNPHKAVWYTNQIPKEWLEPEQSES